MAIRATLRSIDRSRQIPIPGRQDPGEGVGGHSRYTGQINIENLMQDASAHLEDGQFREGVDILTPHIH
jgi:hypothetical protein